MTITFNHAKSDNLRRIEMDRDMSDFDMSRSVVAKMAEIPGEIACRRPHSCYRSERLRGYLQHFMTDFAVIG